MENTAVDDNISSEELDLSGSSETTGIMDTPASRKDSTLPNISRQMAKAANYVAEATKKVAPPLPPQFGTKPDKMGKPLLESGSSSNNRQMLNDQHNNSQPGTSSGNRNLTRVTIEPQLSPLELDSSGGGHYNPMVMENDRSEVNFRNSIPPRAENNYGSDPFRDYVTGDLSQGNESIQYFKRRVQSSRGSFSSSATTTRGATITYHNISYIVKTKKYPWSKQVSRVVLNNVSGIMRPGMNAIMGPTGSVHCKTSQSNDSDDQDLLAMSDEDLMSAMQDRDKVLTQSVIPELSKNSTHKLTDEEIEAKVAAIVSSRTPMDRLKEMFTVHKTEEVTTHGDVLAYYPLGCFLTSVSIFGPMSMRFHSEEFKKKNQLTAFTSQYLAQRRYIDYTLTRSAKDGALLGLRYTVLTTTAYLLVALTETYLGRSTFWQYGVASGAATALYCINRGPRGIFAGTVIGLFFGLTIGVPLHCMRAHYSLCFEDMEREIVRSKLQMRRAVAEGLSNVA